MITAEQLYEAHRALIAAQDEVHSTEELYPIEGVPFESALYEAALTRLKKAREHMKALMADATPEVIAAAKERARIARESHG
jgi:hypothetical protein